MMDNEKTYTVNGMSDTDKSALIDNALPVIRLLSICAIVAGFGSLVLGIVTIVLMIPHSNWPFTSGSGIWAGITAMMQGACGLQLLVNFNKGFPLATKSWVIGFYTLGIIGMSVAPQHLSYSIMGVTTCASRQTNKQGEELCNPDRHDSLLAVQAVSIVFALVYEMVSVTTLVYMVTKRRLVVLTGNAYADRWYKNCCCRNSNYNDI